MGKDNYIAWTAVYENNFPDHKDSFYYLPINYHAKAQALLTTSDSSDYNVLYNIMEWLFISWSMDGDVYLANSKDEIRQELLWEKSKWIA